MNTNSNFKGGTNNGGRSQTLTLKVVQRTGTGQSAIGTIKRIYSSKGTKHIQLSTQSIGGMSGSPILNMKGEVVGIIMAHLVGSGTGLAVHVEELRKAFGLTNYNIPKNDYSPTIEPWSEAVIKPKDFTSA